MNKETPKKRITPEEFKQAIENFGATKTAKLYGISRTTAWRLAKKVNAECKMGRPCKIILEGT